MYRSPLYTIPFFLSYLLPPVVVLSIFERGWWTFSAVAILFVLLPALDSLFGVAGQWREAPDLAFNKFFRGVTWLWVPVQALLFFWVLRHVANGGVSRTELICASISLGLISGAIGVTFAHEMIHRRAEAERFLGHVLLAMVSYTHFAVNHVHGHHRWVATPHDPATARLNESLYAFVPRSVFGGLRSAWGIHKGKVMRGWLVSASVYAAVAIWGGAMTVVVFAAQSVLAIVIVEVINYVEHYGLLRRQLGQGEYERVAPNHSWDSAYKVTNWLLINLARHADHHCSANKRFQALELLPQAPRLPAGYGAMFLLALVPPFWFAVMNPRVEAAGRLARP